MANSSRAFVAIAATLSVTFAFANMAEAKTKHQAAYKDPNAPVISIIKRIEAASKAGGEDVFSDAFDQIDKLSGSEIQVDMLLIDEYAKDENGPYYEYKDGSFKYNFEPTAKQYNKSSEKGFLAYWLDGEKHTMGSFIGSNAFGVKRLIKKISFKSYELAIINTNSIKYEYIFSIEKDKARFYNYTTTFVVKGYVSKFASGHVGHCEAEFSSPTLDDPQQLSGKRCYLAFTVTEVDLLHDGKVIDSQKIEK